jgi:hypothetical protein
VVSKSCGNLECSDCKYKTRMTRNT